MGRKKRAKSVQNVQVVTASQIIEPQASTNLEVENENLREVINNFAANMQNWGFNFPGSTPPSNQISEPSTVFANLRWWFVSNLRQFLSEAYAEIGLIRNVCAIPVDDALRGGFQITTAQLTGAQISELQSYMDEKDDVQNLGLAAIWNRLFGGAANIIFTDQDPETPLDMAAIAKGEDVEFRPVDMWELFYSLINVPDFELYDMTNLDSYEYFNYYGARIHRSRLLIQRGAEAPSFLRPRLRGWGFSVVEDLINSINQYLKAAALTFEVLDEFKLDVYKIKNLKAASLALNGMADVKKGVDLVNWMKNFQNAIVLDSEDDYDHKQLSFAGLAEAQEGIRMQVASDMRMPMTKLFGQSARGFNSGEDDIEVYNAMVEGAVRNKLKRPALIMVQIRCQELFGFIPDDLKVTFQPLRILSALDLENVKTQKFQRTLQARQAGLISAKNFAEIANKDELFGVKIDVMDEGAGLMQDPEDSIGGLDGEDEEDSLEDMEEADVGDEGPMKKSRVKDTNKSEYDKPLKLVSNQKRLTILPQPYTMGERMRRSVVNSLRFDLEAYKAAGGDGWIDPRRRPFFENPVGVDQGLWREAKKSSIDAFGKEKWQYVAFIYKKLGGSFTQTLLN